MCELARSNYATYRHDMLQLAQTVLLNAKDVSLKVTGHVVNLRDQDVWLSIDREKHTILAFVKDQTTRMNLRITPYVQTPNKQGGVISAYKSVKKQPKFIDIETRIGDDGIDPNVMLGSLHVMAGPKKKTQPEFVWCFQCGKMFRRIGVPLYGVQHVYQNQGDNFDVDLGTIYIHAECLEAQLGVPSCTAPKAAIPDEWREQEELKPTLSLEQRAILDRQAMQDEYDVWGEPIASNV